MRAMHLRGSLWSLLLSALLLAPVWALTPEEATRVGGDLDRVGGALSELNHRLAGVKDSIAQIV